MIAKIKEKVNHIARFLTHDIWRLQQSDTTKSRFNLYNGVKSFILAFRNIDSSQINTRAAALTYSTLLSLVPMLAVLFAIARGFGFRNIVESELFVYFSGHEAVLSKAISFVDRSLEYASGGIFLGVGVILLLYTVINLLADIEDNFNRIWRIKTGRTYYRLFTDYIPLLLITPIFLVLNAGVSIILNSSLNSQLINLFVNPVIGLIPYAITILLYTALYMYVPNTKVKFTSALFGAVFAGIAFQVFQMIYISGQIWISKYNTIYGSFAALPLLLLWLQLSWYITLLGVELSFANQNIKKFSFEREIKNISRRYKDFLTLLITTLIVKRFEKGISPYTADELSEKYKIPTQLTSDILFLLLEIGIIIKTPTAADRVFAYIPAIDINKITIRYLFDKIDLYGSEDFKIDKDILFKKEWAIISNIRSIEIKDDMLIKNI